MIRSTYFTDDYALADAPDSKPVSWSSGENALYPDDVFVQPDTDY